MPPNFGRKIVAALKVRHPDQSAPEEKSPGTTRKTPAPIAAGIPPAPAPFPYRAASLRRPGPALIAYQNVFKKSACAAAARSAANRRHRVRLQLLQPVASGSSLPGTARCRTTPAPASVANVEQEIMWHRSASEFWVGDFADHQNADQSRKQWRRSGSFCPSHRCTAARMYSGFRIQNPRPTTTGSAHSKSGGEALLRRGGLHLGRQVQALPHQQRQIFQHLHHVRAGLALQDQAGDEKLQIDHRHAAAQAVQASRSMGEPSASSSTTFGIPCAPDRTSPARWFPGRCEYCGRLSWSD